MPWAEVFTREPLADDIREKLAQSLSNTMETVEFGHPTESGRTIDWMWFHTLPANMWAVGGRFDDTYVKGRTMCFARIIAPEALMNTELKHRAINAVAKDLREALGVAPNDDATGIWVVCIEIKERQWPLGITSLRSANSSIFSRGTSRRSVVTECRRRSKPSPVQGCVRNS